MLGTIQRDVGTLEHVGDGFALLFQGRDPDRNRDVDAPRALLDHERLGRDAPPHPLRDLAGDVQVGLRHHDDEFLAAVAARQIDATDRLADAHREFAQHVVAGVVAVAVVDRLEEVDVEHHHRQRLAAHGILLGQRRQMALHVAAIVQAGQRIGDGGLDRVLHVVAQMLGVAPPADQCARTRQQFVLVDRAQQVIVDADLEPAQQPRVVLGIGDRQQRHLPGTLQRTRLAAQPQAVEILEAQRNDDQVVVALGRVK